MQMASSTVSFLDLVVFVGHFADHHELAREELVISGSSLNDSSKESTYALAIADPIYDRRCCGASRLASTQDTRATERVPIIIQTHETGDCTSSNTTAIVYQ